MTATANLDDLDAQLAELEQYRVRFAGKEWALRPYTTRLAFERQQSLDSIRHLGEQVAALEQKAADAYEAGDFDQGRELQREASELDYQGEVISDAMIAGVLADEDGSSPDTSVITDTMPVVIKRKIATKLAELYVAAQEAADGEREGADDQERPTSSDSTAGSGTA